MEPRTSDRDQCSPLTQSDIECARTLWSYMKLNHVIEKSDLILGLCSYDIRVAERAARLWLDGMADMIMFSGNTGKLTRGLWQKPEAEVFRQRALEMGVPENKILIEHESCNSGENVRFSYRILHSMNQIPKSVILVQKPNMERRAYATFMKQWPGNLDAVKVTSPSVDMMEYPTADTGDLSDVISVLVGDMERIHLYEELGFQIPQAIPKDVQRDFNYLKSTRRFTSHMP